MAGRSGLTPFPGVLSLDPLASSAVPAQAHLGVTGRFKWQGGMKWHEVTLCDAPNDQGSNLWKSNPSTCEALKHRDCH